MYCYYFHSDTNIVSPTTFHRNDRLFRFQNKYYYDIAAIFHLPSDCTALNLCVFYTGIRVVTVDLIRTKINNKS